MAGPSKFSGLLELSGILGQPVGEVGGIFVGLKILKLMGVLQFVVHDRVPFNNKFREQGEIASGLSQFIDELDSDPYFVGSDATDAIRADRTGQLFR